jgi:hypothetical protein
MSSTMRWGGGIVAAVCAAALVPAAIARPVAAPPSGSVYEGSPGQVAIAVSGPRLSLVAFGFRCTGTRGRTSLNDVPVVWRRNRYRFAVRTHGNVTFANGRTDENAAVRLSGRFSRTTRSIRGRFRVRSRHCHTGYVYWTARRVP